MKPVKKDSTLISSKPLSSIEKSKPVKLLKIVKGLKGRVEKTKLALKNVDTTGKKVSKKKKQSSYKVMKAPKNVNKSSKSHKNELENLKDIDPEFYDFLKQNDKKLLDFNLFDSDESEDDSESNKAPLKSKTNPTGEEETDESENDEGKYHTPNKELEIASDESDYENDYEDSVPGSTEKVTLNLLRQWQIELEKENVSVDIVRKVIQAFSSALASISADEKNTIPTQYKVVGSAIFNGVVQLCVLHIQPAILRILGLNVRSTAPLHKTKKWPKVRGCLRYYLTDLIRLVEQVSSANILSVLLKHLHQMAGMIASYTTLGKIILKRLIVLWSTGDETIRVLAFLCILKITRNQQDSMLHHVLKAMYLSYVRNSKFVSPNTLPSINFMRRSLVEIFALDLNTSYQHAFLYIRQLAIHLRNAVILKKKDSFQAVYNWQFVNSLRLWADLLDATTNKPQLQPLIYPLVTITLGVIRLIPTAQYFPLRFHCVKVLIALARETRIFIPILPLIIEVLRSNTFNRKHTVASMRPLQFTCILRLNKGQLSENGFRDEVIEQVNSLTLEYLAHESASLAFSDLVVPTVLSLKSYLKVCRNANYSRKIKQLLDKIQENARYIDEERRKITFSLNEIAQVQSWESKVYNKGTPLATYYESWLKTHEIKKRRQAAQIDSININYNIPTIKRLNKDGVNIRNENGELELFPSESEEDEPLLIGINKDAKGIKKNGNRKSKLENGIENQKLEPETVIPLEESEHEDMVDIVKELDIEDW
ncbi:PREDICTED: nucleolar complex protein 2 homolog [Bactrocera latifrons]|uniref:Nucleolar complex protein 2 n=1 Tax=Bactrocera latifrons TaxID=174628 RepID=A0A0K8WHN5_BACLA|nr:PREDICTED: nucleolar complex protein 2 homolog [Bactrocera latifrons]